MNMAPKRTPNIVTLALVAALGALAMNVFLPSLPSIQSYFGTTEATAQLAVSIYLAATAILQLIIGPLSDKYGRRPILLIFLLLMLLATLVCIYAPNIEIFLFGRIIQASAAAGIVLSRAIVRDTVGSEDAASKIAYVTMGMTLVPMFAPALGGLLEEQFGWQASFWLIFGFGLLIVLIVWLDLNETHLNRGGSFATQFRSVPALLTSKRFMGYSATCAFSSGAYFAFLGGGALVAINYYELSPSAFGLYHIYIALGYLIGNFLAGRFSRQVGLNRMMMLGNLSVLAGLSLSLLLTQILVDSPAMFFGLVFFVGFGNGVTLPNANAGIVNVRPDIAGAASGLGGSMQIGGGAVLAAITGYLVDIETGPFYLLIMMIASIICAILSTLYVIHIERLRQQEACSGE
ncbi:MAG: multidrug effflux MFS transporter [Pseudomonadota bacterium]